MLKKLLKGIKNLRIAAENRVKNFGAQYTAFAIFGILNYPIFYLIWIHSEEKSYENLSLRIIASLLCLFLLFRKYWPNRLKPWLPLYWNIILTFCLPFFFFFMMLKNHGSNVWLMSSNTIIFWLILMVDWISYFFIFIFGLIAAILLYVSTSGLIINFYAWWGVLTQFIASFVVIVFFAQNKFRYDREKLAAMRTLGDNIAHELRTPLAAIGISTEAIRNYLPDLVDGYRKAEQNDLPVTHIRNSQLTMLSESLDYIEAESKFANMFITMLLTKTTYFKDQDTDEGIYSISDCVNKALARYPFRHTEHAMVNWKSKNDFHFKGSEILIIHVLFNLIKNALYYIAAAGDGEISIRLGHEKKYNTLYFRDTGTGIAEADLPRIFERFYTKTGYGTGIGLAFCKMVMEFIDGDITVSSIEGKYTEFVLYFLKV